MIGKPDFDWICVQSEENQNKIQLFAQIILAIHNFFSTHIIMPSYNYHENSAIW